MPLTLQRQQQGNRAGRKGRRQIRLEAQLANRQIRFDGQVSQFARKCIIVMRDAVCDDQIRTVRTEGASFGQVIREACVFFGVIFRALVHDAQAVAADLRRGETR